MGSSRLRIPVSETGSMSQRCLWLVLLWTCFCSDTSETSSTAKNTSLGDFDTCRFVDEQEWMTSADPAGVIWMCWSSEENQGDDIRELLMTDEEVAGSRMVALFHNCTLADDMRDISGAHLVTCWMDLVGSGGEASSEDDLVYGVAWRYYSRFYDYCFYSQPLADDPPNSSYALNCWLEENPDSMARFPDAATKVD